MVDIVQAALVIERLHYLKDFSFKVCLKCEYVILNKATATILEKDWQQSKFNCEVVPPREGKTFKMATGGNH